jgi:hypothetical protein
MTKVIAMNYTPYAHNTDAEVVLAVCNSEAPSELEIELVQRLEGKEDEIEDLKNHIAELEAMEPADVDA